MDSDQKFLVLIVSIIAASVVCIGVTIAVGINYNDKIMVDNGYEQIQKQSSTLWLWQKK